MDILWLALIIQTIFFIVKNAYIPVLIFIITSLLVQVFSKNPLYFILFPMIVAHAFYYCYSGKKEGFRLKKYKFIKKAGKACKAGKALMKNIADSARKKIADSALKYKTVLDSKINEINNVKNDYIRTKSELDKCNRAKSSLESANRKLHSANQIALSDIATANNKALNEERAKTNTCNTNLSSMTRYRDQIEKERDKYIANNKALTTDLNKANALSEARKKSLATAKDNMNTIYTQVKEYE
jgi:chromosome segregation ATPase